MSSEITPSTCTSESTCPSKSTCTSDSTCTSESTYTSESGRIYYPDWKQVMCVNLCGLKDDCGKLQFSIEACASVGCHCERGKQVFTSSKMSKQLKCMKRPYLVVMYSLIDKCDPDPCNEKSDTTCPSKSDTTCQSKSDTTCPSKSHCESSDFTSTSHQCPCPEVSEFVGDSFFDKCDLSEC